MLDDSQPMTALQADIDALRVQFPRTADLYREACSVMFFRYGLTPTTNALYQLVRKGSMSVPTEALRQFWNELRKRARVDLQHVDLPDQIKESAGKLIGEIWSLARKAADESITALRQTAAAERDAALAEKARYEHDAARLAAELEEVVARIRLAEVTNAELREEISAAAASKRETDSHLVEARAHIERLQGQIERNAITRATELDKITGRVLLAERRYADLEKRSLRDVDRERTAAAKVQKQLDAERRASASRIEEAQAQAQAAQIQFARQGRELGTFMAKAELLADERDRAARQAAESATQNAELNNLLAGERAKVAELRRQLEQVTSASKPGAGQPRAPASAPRHRRPKLGE